MMMNKDDLFLFLEKTYYNPEDPNSFTTPEKLLKAAHENGFTSARIGAVEEFLNKQEVHSRFVVPQKRFKRKQLQSWAIDVQWEGDLLDLRNYSRQNRGINYLFNLVDTLSRFCFLLPIKNKTAVATKNALESLIESSKRKPTSIRLDRGNEFMGDFAKYCEKEKIRIVPAYAPLKASLAENLNKRVSNKIYKWMYNNNSKKWLTIIKEVENSLNSTFMTSINCEPVSINYLRQNDVDKRLYKKPLIKSKEEKSFQIGDKVRILEEVNIFKKFYRPHFTKEIFTVDKIFDYSNPRLYILIDEDGEKLAKRYLLKKTKNHKHI